MPGRGVESLGKGAGALRPLLPGPGGLWPAGVRPSWCDHSPPAALPPRGAKVRRPPALRKDHPITNTNQAAPPARLAAVVRPFGAAAGVRCHVLLRGRRGARGPPLVRGVRRLPCRKKAVPARCSARCGRPGRGRPGPLPWCPGLCPRSGAWAALRVRCRPPAPAPAAGARRGAPGVGCPGALRGKGDGKGAALDGHARQRNHVAARFVSAAHAIFT